MLPFLAVRDSKGISLLDWTSAKPLRCDSQTICEDQCRVLKISKNGRRIAWGDGKKVYVMDTASRSILVSIDMKRTYAMTFSPDENLFAVWESFVVTKDQPNGTKNLQIWNVESGNCLHQMIQKKINGWEPKWLNGANICAKLVGNSVHFFAENNFEAPVEKLHIDKLDSFEISPNCKPPYYVACFSRGSKGAPSSVRVFKYPKLSRDDVIANKSFFKADNVKILWNNKGTALLVRASVDVDTTGESYYGEQSLHFMSCNGETSIVNLSKKGPIYDAAWAPNSSQFCVVFGFMPAKACVFNSKCDQVFEFGPTPRNECYFNPQGNLLALAGFGNLRGNIEIWDYERKKQISQFQSPDTTYFEWSSDGAHFITATTSPRLRVGNGYKLWHYTDGVCYEHKAVGDVYEVAWQTLPHEAYPAPVVEDVSSRKINNIINESKPASYVPPYARGKSSYTAAKDRFKRGDAVAEPEPESLSKAAQKNKKKREMKKNKQTTDQSTMSSEQYDAVQMAKYLLNDTTTANNQTNSTINETDKKIKALKKKLQAIEKLKTQQSQGKQLEKNQLEKLNTENTLLQELEKLKLSG